jgi:GTP-binding protein
LSGQKINGFATMKIKNVTLYKTVFTQSEIVNDKRPKIVFMGRSNVGKSSLINSLCNRKHLARTSSRPGKTVSINYFLVNEQFYFVDLPGYGYAKISKSESQRVKHLISGFFNHIESGILVIMLIDSRRGFMESDIELLNKIIQKNYKILTILTKGDKISASQLKNQTLKYQKEFDLIAIPFSIKSSHYKENILKYIEKALTAVNQDQIETTDSLK